MNHINVINNIGYVRLVDTLGSDLSVVNAARVSYDKESTELSERDQKLIRFLLKENHKNTYDSIGSMLKNIEHIEQIQVEVENIKELKEVLSLGVKNILLDNFSIEDCKKSVELNHGEALLEASGNINQKNILHYARTGVDRISIGAITKNIRSIDFSMLFSPQKPL